jgi:hypothetical protein
MSFITLAVRVRPTMPTAHNAHAAESSNKATKETRQATETSPRIEAKVKPTFVSDDILNPLMVSSTARKIPNIRNGFNLRYLGKTRILTRYVGI